LAVSMPKAVSLRQRIEIVLGWSKGIPYRDIAEAQGVSKSAVAHWVAEWTSGGNMEEKPRPGRPAVLGAVAKRFARIQLKKPGFGGLDRAARVLHSHAHTATVIHKSTLSRMLKQRAMMHPTRLVPDRRPPAYTLTALDKERRLQFAVANESRDWSSVMFTDRKRFYFRYPGSKVARVQWHEQGCKRQVFKPTNPQCVNVYMGITKYGTTTAIQVAGSSKHKSPYSTKKGTAARNITAAEYQDVLLHHLLPKGQGVMEGAGHRRWWFQQDNDPTHRLAGDHILTFRAFAKGTCHLLPNWPPHSPDLNLIENIWADVQADMNEKGCKTFAAFHKRLMWALDHVPKEKLAEAFNGMATRIKETIRLGGDKTKH
jgi:transposase